MPPYYHGKSKLKEIDINNLKEQINKNKKLKEIDVKNCTCYYFDNIINIHDLDNILIDLKSYKNISICKGACKITYVLSFCVLLPIKQLNTLEII